MTAAWIAAAFLSGVGVGALWRESYEILRGREDPMRLLRLTFNVRALVVALLVSMLINTGVGVMVIINESADRRAAACNIEYNNLTGEARDARTGIGDTTGDAQLDYVRDDLAYQRDLLASITRDDVTTEDLAGVIARRAESADRYLALLERQSQVRAAAPYPPADFCADR